MIDATQLAAAGAVFVAGELALAVLVGRLLARAGQMDAPGDATPLATVFDLSEHRALRSRA